jgi:small subunit ribosomal protein S17
MDTQARTRRRTVEGIVTSDKMTQTITVLVERTYKHPKYGKYIRKAKKYHAHDEEGTAKTGDLVEIVECRPMSKLKRWRLVRVVRAGAVTSGTIDFAPEVVKSEAAKSGKGGDA